MSENLRWGSRIRWKEGCKLASDPPQTQAGVRFREDLDALSDTQWVRLGKAADYHARGATRSADDLLQEAMLRSLDGTRNRPADVHLVTFLSNVMKSIASADRQKVNNGPSLVPLSTDSSGALGSVDPDRIDSPGVRIPSAEDVALGELEPDQLLDQVFNLFTGDEPAFMVLLALSEGQTAQQIRDEQDLDMKTYATIRRRIRRRIDKAGVEDRLIGQQ